MTERIEKVAFIINTASYERVAFALGAATGAATVKDVRIIFGNGGVFRLKKGSVDSIGEETESWIRQRVKLAVKKGSLPAISELIENLNKFGAKIYACPAAMELHNLVVQDLVKEVDEVRSVVRFMLEDIKDATVIYV